MPEMIPPLVSLYAFVLVAETGSLTAAAERLNVTQPAISKRIRVLEAELGVALLQRGANATQLTDAGRLLAISLTEGFAKIRQATESYRVCRVGLCGYARTILGPCVGSFPGLGAFASFIPSTRLL